MTAECELFWISPQHCNYAETELHFKMFRMRIPCNHRFVLIFRQGITERPFLSEIMDSGSQKISIIFIWRRPLWEGMTLFQMNSTSGDWKNLPAKQSNDFLTQRRKKSLDSR
jgi:hypothetical protein